MTELALTGVAVAAVLYWFGTRAPQGSRAFRERQWRAQAFYAGLVALALAIAPPLDGLADKLFWSRVLDSPPFRARLTHAWRLAFLVSAGLAEAALSVVILAQHAPLYAPYKALVPRPEHLSALADQQLGGAIMLEPASIPLLIAVIWSIGGLLAPRRKPRMSPADTAGV